MLEELKRKVFLANMDLVKNGLVIYTWGNVSMIDRSAKLVAIKPSGVDYAQMTEDDVVIVDLDGRVVEGKYKPSSDTSTHLVIYKAFESIGAIAHSHSKNATAFAQGGKSIVCYGTTHADYFYKDIPVTRALTKNETLNDYEANTGNVIVETLNGTDVMATPAVLVRNHGVFTFGEDAYSAVYNATVLETIAEMAIKTLIVNPRVERIEQYVSDKHYNRKHGRNAYYGQGEKK